MVQIGPRESEIDKYTYYIYASHQHGA